MIHGHEVEAVLFDAGGIFVIPDPHVVSPLLQYYGAVADLDRYHRAHYAGMAAKSAAGSGERDWSEYNRAYVESVGVPSHDRDEAAVVLDRTRNAYIWRHPLAESVAALRALYDMQVPIGVVSNATGQIESVLARSGVCQVGDGPGFRCASSSTVMWSESPSPIRRFSITAWRYSTASIGRGWPMWATV